MIAITEGATEQIRPNRLERERLLSGVREETQAQIEEFLQGVTDAHYVGNAYIGRLESVVAESERYTPNEQKGARLALALFEVALLGTTPESVQARIANLPEPKVDLPPERSIGQKVVQQVRPELGNLPQVTHPRFCRRVLFVLDQAELYSSPQVIAVNLALDEIEGWEREEFEPETVRVPAGPFLMGSADDDSEAKDEEKPQHTVELEAYRIGRYPVTNVQYQTFVQETGYQSPEHWSDSDYPEKKADHPVVNVSWDDAMTYCRWLSDKTGKNYRLPTEAEWEKAARGTSGQIYPWGDEFDQNNCNSSENDIDDTTPVDQYSPTGDSPYGATDMAGNVWEWTLSLWGQDQGEPEFKYPYNFEDGRENLETQGHRVLRGGSGFYRWDQATVQATFRGKGARDVGQDRGFRVGVFGFRGKIQNKKGLTLNDLYDTMPL